MTATFVEEPSVPAGTEAANVYEAIGGQAAITAAVDAFYGRLIADPVLGPLFPGGVADRHKRYVVTILGEALGGPETYRGPDIARAHRRLSITDNHFDLAAGHLVATLDDLGVPRHLADQVVAVVAGTRLAVVTA
jgi:hemoglobin